MPIANMRALLEQARSEGRAVGAFSVSGIEMIRGVLRAAQALDTPVILQVAESRLPAAPLPLLGSVMLAAAREAAVPVAVHLDHGLTLPCIRQALEMGFTSVMYDGSALPMEENIENTLRVIEMAKPFGAAVEAEIGRVGRTEEGGEQQAVCARPEDCLLFAKSTGVDALAVAIGNAHGVYTGAPKLRFDVLEALQGRGMPPLVLHGGTGISDEDFRRCIRLGVHKINIATASFQAAAQAARAQDEYFAMLGAMADAVAQVAERHIRVFGAKQPGYTAACTRS